MFTLAGFFESSGATSLTEINALADPHLSVTGDDVAVPVLGNLAGAYVKSNTGNDGRVVSPSLRRIVTQSIIPVREGASDLNRDPENYWMDLFEHMIPLDVGEAINLKMSESTASDAVYGLLWFADAIEPVPAGPFRTVRASATTTLTANVWTNFALTFDEDLPAGRYAIIGAAGQSAGMVAFRFVLQGYGWRPGTIGMTDVSYVPMSSFRYGRKGSWGEFEHNIPPTVDGFSISGDTTEKIWLDLIQVRGRGD